MKGGPFLGFLAGALFGVAAGFVAFSGGQGAEALDLDLDGPPRADAGRDDTPVAAAPPVGADRGTSPAPEVRAASLASLPPETGAAAAPVGDGVIEGRVTDEDGAPVAGVLVRAEKAGERTLDEPDDVGAPPDDRPLDEVVEEAAAEWHERRESRREATTGADGRYRFEDLADDGRYHLQAYASGYVLEPRSGSAWSIRPGSTVNFEAKRVVELPVTVTRPGGGAIDRVGLRVERERNGSRHREDVLWRRGRRTMKVAPGTLTLKAFVDEALARRLGVPEMTSDEATADVRSGAAPAPVVLELRPQVGVRGRVIVPDDVTFQQARAVLLPAPSGEIDPAIFENGENTTWLHGRRREFEFLDLVPGRYAVGIARGWNSPAIAHAVADVADGVVTLDIELPDSDAASGLIVRVRDHAGRAVPVSLFSYVCRSGPSSHSSHLQSQPRGPGEYGVDLDGRLKNLFDAGAFPADTSVDLTVHSRTLGTKSVPLSGARREVDVVFGEPATLDVTVAGYVGSGLEGQLHLQLARKGARSNYSFGGNDRGIAADGTESLGPVEAGDHQLELKVRDRRGGYWNDRTLASVELRLVPGANVATIAVPPLYTLTVRFDEIGGHLQVNGADGTHLNRQVEEEAVELTALPAGKYTLRRWGSGQDGTMVVNVPDQREVRFAPSRKNGLAVFIHDPNAWVARAGIESGDVIIAFAGREFTDETGMRAAWTEALKAGKRGVTVLRGDRRVSIDVGLEDLMVKGEEGASLRPMAR